MSARLPMTLAPGHILTAAKAETLRMLAGFGDAGSCASWPSLPGGTLAMLVQFGVAEHAPDLDALGGRRYRVTAKGRDVLGWLGLV